MMDETLTFMIDISSRVDALQWYRCRWIFKGLTLAADIFLMCSLFVYGFDLAQACPAVWCVQVISGECTGDQM